MNQRLRRNRALSRAGAVSPQTWNDVLFHTGLDDLDQRRPFTLNAVGELANNPLRVAAG